MRNHLSLTRTWTWESQPAEIAGQLYVNEHCSDQNGFIRYGPMLESLAEAFVEARKQHIDALHKQAVARLQSQALRSVGIDGPMKQYSEQEIDAWIKQHVMDDPVQT